MIHGKLTKNLQHFTLPVEPLLHTISSNVLLPGTKEFSEIEGGRVLIARK